MEAEKDLIQIRSLTTVAIAWYSALAKEQDTVVYFFVLHDMGNSPNVTK